MGSPLAEDRNLSLISSFIESNSHNLLSLLTHNYNKQNLSLGSCYNGSDVESFLGITDSEFENIFLALIYNGGSYRMELKSINQDPTFYLKLDLDELQSAQLPEKMKEELQTKYNELIFTRYE